MYTTVQKREIFHFCFLEKLLRISDPKLYVLKGGVNLRFFFNSPRYSEDMDLDALAGDVNTLKKNVYKKILNDDSFQRSLRTYSIEDFDINDPGKAKQTKTTQRFEVGLIETSKERLSTKVEFSRREPNVGDSKLELVNPEIARAYNKLSFRCYHYTAQAMAVQKIHALAKRPQTQARDVFDLYILIANGYLKTLGLKRSLSKELLRKARHNLLLLDYDDFSGQVLEFLDQEQKHQYEGKFFWDTLVEQVLNLITDGN